jgi:hypothetical protein
MRNAACTADRRACGRFKIKNKQKGNEYMAQKRKKKKQQPQRTNVRRVASSVIPIKSFAVIRKLLQAYGLAPDALDSLTKQQRNFLSYSSIEPIRFKAQEGYRIPRSIISFLTESAHHFLRTSYFGDKSIGLTYLELSTYGLSLAYTLKDAPSCPPFQTGGRSLETVASVSEIISCNRVHKDLNALGAYVLSLMTMISKVSLRIYGYDWKIEDEKKRLVITSTIYLSSEDPVSIRFKYRQTEQTAFRVRAGRIIEKPSYNVTIDRRLISNKHEHPPVYLGIYIQTHVFRCAREWMDVFPAHRRNYYVMDPLLFKKRVQKSPSGRPMLLCYFREKGRTVYLGYFPFIIQRKKLIVQTFLPLISDDTPAGEYLREHLGLQAEDIKTLGMDKLGFFYSVDLSEIPVLKKALAATNVQNLIRYAIKYSPPDFNVDREKTQMVKEFFKQKANCETTAVQEAPLPLHTRGDFTETR